MSPRCSRKQRIPSRHFYNRYWDNAYKYNNRAWTKIMLAHVNFVHTLSVTNRNRHSLNIPLVGTNYQCLKKHAHRVR